MKTKFVKQAIHDKPELLPSAIGFDNAYPEHREQKYNGYNGWHTWMIQQQFGFVLYQPTSYIFYNNIYIIYSSLNNS